jgi:hypothetical protein
VRFIAMAVRPRQGQGDSSWRETRNYRRESQKAASATATSPLLEADQPVRPTNL